MKYSDGQEIMLGDKVTEGGDKEEDAGVVVCVIDSKQYTSDNPESKWGYLKKGAVILFKKYGYIYYDVAFDDLKLIARRKLE